MMSTRLASTMRTLSHTGRVSSTAHRFMSVINISDLDATKKFGQVNDKSVLYFTATWCGPCRAIKPIYDELATKYPGVAFGKIDVDDNSDAAAEHAITSVPTFIFYNGEESIDRFAGADPGRLEASVQALDAK